MEQKTNAMRILEQMDIAYDTVEYDCGTFRNAVETAKKCNIRPEQLFKTLVSQGKSEKFYAFAIPCNRELDMKKASKAVGEKSISLVPVNDLNRLTGYIRGCCTPLGIKRQCKTVVDSSCNDVDVMFISSGRMGCMISLTPFDFVRASNAILAEITLDEVILN